MRNLSWSILGALACGLPVACADPCIDDGLGQAICPTQNSAGDTEGATDSSSATMGSVTMSSATAATMTMGMSGSQTSGETDSDTEGTADGTAEGTATQGETGGSLWCVDADGDGYGDPDQCQNSDEPIDGSVPNGDDCDDSNPATFPGAAPNDDPDACMQDEDDDDWGDDMPPPGVDPGTDCLDEDDTVSPGAAENEPRLCAQDEDDDGWGDDMPPPGVDPGSDCADDNPNAFPGAAEEEDPPDLCAEDEDGDGWGDLDPPPGVEPGNDCDDENADAFPGAAPNEDPPDLCTVDADGDGWGDANPGGGGGGPGPQSGSDCYDANPDLNPDTLQLTAFAPYQGGPGAVRTIQTIDPANADLNLFVTLTTPMGGIPNVNLVSATLNEAGEIFASDLTNVQLVTADYAGTCMMGQGVLAPAGMPYAPAGTVVCGLEFDGAGTLYGIDLNDTLRTFDPATGQLTGMPIPLQDGGVPINVTSCGMAYDCTGDRLLLANGGDWSIYEIDRVTGQSTVLRDLDPFFGPQWTPVGLEYDPVSGNAYLSIGPSLWEVELDSAAPPVLVGNFAQTVSNLQYLPICQ
ncbi:MAG: hypothetical protein KC501_37805 [Myxococcales bacterium]|nr:hypothetical protein [Myxococcales bacterium]